MPKSDFWSRKALNHVLAVEPFPAPAGIWLALFNSTEGLKTGSLAHEVAGGSYVRQPVLFRAAAAGRTANSGPVDFPVATEDWGPMVGWAILDAVFAGNVLYWGEFPMFGEPSQYKTVFVGDSLRIRDQDLEIFEE
ncbi:MAG: hypothetical protein AB7D47_04310 [Desulfovibrio sp.]|jgi:hypothetical protein